jgi:hypothetical protein
VIGGLSCSRHAPSDVQFASALRAPRGLNGCPALCRAADSIAHRRGGFYSSAPGALAQVRVIVSRTVITYSAPSVSLAGTSRFHRMAAYTQCLRCAGAPKRPPDSHCHDDQRICASNRDAEINVGHDVLRLELGLAVEHRTTPCNCLSWIHQAEDRNSFRGNVPSSFGHSRRGI